MNIEQLELILTEMKCVQNVHDEAKVTFDAGNHKILVTYPLPKDFYAVGKSAQLGPA